MRKHRVIIGSLFSLIAAAGAEADMIAGPALTLSTAAYQNTGIEFSALTDSILTGFVFQNQGAADVVQLRAADGSTVLHALSTPAGNPSYSVSGLSWDLTAGRDYFLLEVSSPSNGRFSSSTFPVSDTEISVIAGDFSQVAGSTTSRTDYWADFNNITTTASVPEPSSFVLLGLSVLVAFAGHSWRRGRPIDHPAGATLP